MNQYKVAFWLNSLDIGGTTKAAVLFAKYLPKSKYNITFFTYADADRSREKEINDLGCKVEYVFRNQNNWKFLEYYDLVHSFRSGQFELPEIGFGFNGPKFVETNAFGLLSNNPKINKTLFMSKWLMNDTISKYNIKNLNRFDFIYNPIEMPITVDKFENPFGDSTFILGRNGRPEDGVYDEISVKAASKVLDIGYKVGFLCLGCPPSMERDLNLYKIPYQIIDPTIDPYIISKFYNSIDLYCEGRPDGHTFGNVLAEAMIHKKTCIVHKAIPKYPGMGVWQAQTETISNEETGIVVDYNIDEYAGAIIEMILNHTYRIKLEVSAKEYARDQFDARIGALKLDFIYNNV